jgi:hypothetical protein
LGINKKPKPEKKKKKKKFPSLPLSCLFPEKTKNSAIKIFPEKKKKKSNDNLAIKKKQSNYFLLSLFPVCFPRKQKTNS